MFTNKSMWGVLLLGVVVFVAHLSLAAEVDQPCAVFEEGELAAPLVASMLEASEKGRLFRIKPETSRVGFCVEGQLADVNGVFTEFNGGLALVSGGGAKGQALVKISAESLETQASMIESLLKSEKFFDVMNYPEILFVSKNMTWTSLNTALLDGDLTLHGVTRPIVFDVNLTDVEPGTRKNIKLGEMILVNATTKIKRSDFGMDALSSVVSDYVKLCIEVEATKFKKNDSEG